MAERESSKRPADEFWDKIEWEGGVPDAIDYGLDAAEYDLPAELVQAWDEARAAWAAFDRAAEKVRRFDPAEDDGCVMVEAAQCDEVVRQLGEMIEQANLGPVASIKVFDDPPGLIVVELDAASPHKARTLLRWLDVIDVRDMIAGKPRDRDNELRLNIRGQFPSSSPVVVVAVFDERAESEQTRLIDASIERQQPHELVGQLADSEHRADELDSDGGAR